MENGIVLHGGHCTWIGDPDKATLNPRGKLCCPHCGGPLLAKPKDKWDRDLEEYIKTHPGYDQFIEWCQTQICQPSLQDAMQRYRFKNNI